MKQHGYYTLKAIQVKRVKLVAKVHKVKLAVKVTRVKLAVKVTRVKLAVKVILEVQVQRVTMD